MSCNNHHHTKHFKDGLRVKRSEIGRANASLKREIEEALLDLEFFELEELFTAESEMWDYDWVHDDEDDDDDGSADQFEVDDYDEELWSGVEESEG